MMKKDMISILIPVYNVEYYIEETLNYILMQDYKNYEVIMVNDGSSDNSGKICEKYAKLYSNFLYFEQENAGVSSARNACINNASGEYVIFIDPDDILYEHTLSKWHKAIVENNHCDIIFGNYMEISGNKETPKIFPYDNTILQKNNLDLCLDHIYGNTPMIGWGVWKQCYRLDIIRNNRIYFDTSMTIAEDGNWLVDYILHANSFAAINDIVYGYRIFSNTSITAKKYTYEKFKNSTQFYTRWYIYFKNQYNGQCRNKMMNRFAEGFTNAASSIASMDKVDYEQSIRLLEQHKELLYNSKRNAHKMLAIVLKLFGLRMYVHATWYSRRMKDILLGRSETK